MSTQFETLDLPQHDLDFRAAMLTPKVTTQEETASKPGVNKWIFIIFAVIVIILIIVIIWLVMRKPAQPAPVADRQPRVNQMYPARYPMQRNPVPVPRNSMPVPHSPVSVPHPSAAKLRQVPPTTDEGVSSAPTLEKASVEEIVEVPTRPNPVALQAMLDHAKSLATETEDRDAAHVELEQTD